MKVEKFPKINATEPCIIDNISRKSPNILNCQEKPDNIPINDVESDIGIGTWALSNHFCNY